MTVKLHAVVLSSSLMLLAILTGCAKPYKMPEPGAPAAIVKIKPSYDRNRFVSYIPYNGTSRNLELLVTIVENKKTFILDSRDYTASLQSSEPLPLEMFAVRLHPDREGIITVHLSVKWQTTAMKRVMESIPKTRTVTRSVSEYDYYTKQNKVVQRTVTETYYEQKEVEKLVTDNHAVGCSASVTLKPMKDNVYILDYTNLMAIEGCSLKGYLQSTLPDGTFKMEPI